MRRHPLRSTPGQGHTPRPRGRCANCETFQGPFVAVAGFPPLRVCKPTRRLIRIGENEVEDRLTGEIAIEPVTMVVMAAPECRARRNTLDRERYEPAMRR